MSISLLSVAASSAAEPPIGVVVATGVVIVFSVLILLYLLITVEGIIFKSIDNKKKGNQAADKPAASAPQTTRVQSAPNGAAMAVQQGISGEVIAAISAAIACMEGGNKLTVRSVTRAKTNRSAWSGAASAGYTEPF